MAIKKVYELAVDLKRTSVRVNIPVLVQGDSAEFRIRLLDNGAELSTEKLTGITKVSMQSGYDAQTVIQTVGTLQGSVAVFRLKKNELFRSGTVQAMVQLEDTEDRISTLRFQYQVIPDLAGNYIPGEQDITVFQRYMNEAQAKIDEMAATDVSQFAAQLAETGERIDTILTTPVEGISAQEIIDARKDGASLGTTIRNIDDKLDFPATNIIQNGDFSSSIQYSWVPGSSATVSALNKILKVKGTGSSPSPNVRKDITLHSVKDKKIFLGGFVKITNPDATKITLNVGTTLAEATQVIDLVTAPVENQEYRVGRVITLHEDVAANLRLRFLHTYADAATALNKEMEMRYFFALDLTQMFGAGNEPSAEEVEFFLLSRANKWFDGTAETFIKPEQTFKYLNGEVKKLKAEGNSPAPIVSNALPEYEGGYSWWVYPNIVKHNSKTYMTYVREYQTFIASFNHLTKAQEEFSLQTDSVNDEHNTAAVCVMPDGKILTAYSKHNSEAIIYVRRSSKAESLEGFEDAIALPSQGNVTYAQLLYVGSKYFLFYRSGSTFWAVRTSTNGLTWTDEVRYLSASGQYYMRAVPYNGGFIRIYTIGHPINSAEHDIHYVALAAASGEFRVFNGVVVGNLNGAGLPLQSSSLPSVFVQEAGNTTRLFDVNASPNSAANISIAHATFSHPYNGDAVYQVTSGTSDNFVTATVCKAGLPLEVPAGNNHYYGGMWFHWNNDKIVYVAREVDGMYRVEQYRTEDYITWNYSQTLDGGFMKLHRPTIPFGGGDLVWQVGYYTTFKDYRSKLKSKDWMLF